MRDGEEPDGGGRRRKAAGRVTLRGVRPEDLPHFFEHQRDPEGASMAAFPSRDQAAFDAHWLKILNDPAVTVLAVLWEGRLAGNVVSFSGSGGREVGYWIGREFWGHGVATEALRAFLEVERERPLFAYVAPRNSASVRVLEKCGFLPARPVGETRERVMVLA